jgi:hypothetical protein
MRKTAQNLIPSSCRAGHREAEGICRADSLYSRETCPKSPLKENNFSSRVCSMNVKELENTTEKRWQLDQHRRYIFPRLANGANMIEFLGHFGVIHSDNTLDRGNTQAHCVRSYLMIPLERKRKSHGHRELMQKASVKTSTPGLPRLRRCHSHDFQFFEAMSV